MWKDSVICYIGGGVVSAQENGYKTTAFFGKIVNEIASHFKKMILVVPVVSTQTQHDWVLGSNIEVRAVPVGGTAIGNVKVTGKWKPIVTSAILSSDCVFIRGLFTPALGCIYKSCREQRKPLLHWIIGNPKALLRSHRRSGFLKDGLGIIYTHWWCAYLDYLHNSSRGMAGYICNGSEIRDAFSKLNSWTIVSSTLTESDYFWRNNTCFEKVIRIGTLCYLRPEKGIEDLIESFSLVDKDNVELHVYGGFGKYSEYKDKIGRQVAEMRRGNKIKFIGEVKSVDVPLAMRELDIFVLPTLSEGTPRVILEAQANCVPVVATRVGGIPDMIVDEYNGLLVDPRSPSSLAQSIEKLIDDYKLREKLIANGFRTARSNDLVNLVGNIIDKFSIIKNQNNDCKPV